MRIISMGEAPGEGLDVAAEMARARAQGAGRAPARHAVRISDPFPNCERVHPSQQARVKDIVEGARGDGRVRRVIVFGSAVNGRWRQGSDLDVYIEQDEEERPWFVRGLPYPVDAWTTPMADERLLREIEGKGVTVYEADRHSCRRRRDGVRAI